jgi:Tfp pilus assembly protein PilF
MSRLWDRGLALGLGGLLLVQVGCAGTAGLSSTTASAPVSAPGGHDDLSPDKALQTVLTCGRTLDKAGNDDGAIVQYEKVLQLSPNHVEASRRLAVLYDRRSDFTRSEPLYRQLAQSHPRDADLFCDWGYSYYLRNNWKEAEVKLRRALEIDRRHARARCNLGLVLGQQDRYTEAFQMFRDAGLDEADAHCDLAFVYWSQSHHLEDAKRECQRACQLNSACSRAKELLAQLEHSPKGPPDKVQSREQARERARQEAMAAIAAGRTSALPNGGSEMISEDHGQATYRLPPGWAPMPTQSKPAAPTPAADGATAPAAQQPAAPAASEGVGTVTFGG